MRPNSKSCRSSDAGWAFRATNAQVFEALARCEHGASLREYFGTQAHEELSGLAATARLAAAAGRRGRLKARNRGSARHGSPRSAVLIVPGMMGSRLCEISGRGAAKRPARTNALWMDPLRIAAGDLGRLSLTRKSSHSIRPAGALLPAYAKLKLMLSIEGFEARYFAYDWRLGIDRIGAALASKIRAGGKPVSLIAHSMGGLVARIAAKELPKRLIKRLVLLGTPNQGAFAPVLALRGTYPFVLRLSRLDLEHSPEDLASAVFCTFPGLCQLLPAAPMAPQIDLLDPRSWPDSGPKPDAALLGRVAEARARMAAPDERMAHIVGVNRETVVSVCRTPAGFEYCSSRNGDGTVPVSLAMLPALETYFADEGHGELANNPSVIAAIVALLRGEGGGGLPQRFTPSTEPLTRFDDAQLRCSAEVAKIDWRRLDSAQREAVLAELDGGRPGTSAESLA
jgi:pimeloyl-ACP methyl ester carboxylesterase